MYINILPIFFLSQVSNIYTAYLDNVIGCTSPYNSNVNISGTFSRPNYTQFENGKIHCRFDFIGRENERVQIIFQDFNLYRPESNFSDCLGADTLSAFVHVDQNKLARIDDFCGSNTPPSIMSNGPKLTLEFNAPSSNQNVSSFSGIYNFVKGLYPRDTSCHYYFHGQVNEHVEIYFTYFQVEGIPPCDEETYSDSVEFSNYMPIDRKFDRQCGLLRKSEKKIKSDSKFFRVTFNSNDKFDATGFHATYQFSDKSKHSTIRNIKTSGGRAGNSIKITQFLLLFMPFVII